MLGWCVPDVYKRIRFTVSGIRFPGKGTPKSRQTPFGLHKINSNTGNWRRSVYTTFACLFTGHGISVGPDF
jgi:hypothetical protein